MESKVESSEQNARPSDRLLRGLLWGVLALVIIGILGANLRSFIDRKPGTTAESPTLLSDLAAHQQLPDFALTDQRGAPFALSDLHNKVWVADFIFTSCPTICPPMTIQMASLQDEFSAEEVHFVSFSVDPERDTPEVLLRYANDYGADGSRWAFLTGQRDTIYQLAHEGFNLAAGHRGSEILHSTRFVLVDQNQQVRGYYDSRNPGSLHQLRKDIKKLLEE